MERNIRDAVFYIYAIERTLPRRKPTIERWGKYHMTNTEKWYYAYTIREILSPWLILVMHKICIINGLWYRWTIWNIKVIRVA